MVFVGGDITAAPPPDPDAFVVGCDGGYDHALAGGHRVDLLIGDLDSVSAAGIANAEEAAEIERHPEAKDATDFELAIDACRERGISTIDVYGGEGGRIDHFLGVATSLTRDRWTDTTVRWHTSTMTVIPMVGPTSVMIDAPTSGTVSLIAMTDAMGITTTGLAWKLVEDRLERGASRGISNVATESSISISLTEGVLLVTVSVADGSHPVGEGTHIT